MLLFPHNFQPFACKAEGHAGHKHAWSARLSARKRSFCKIPMFFCFFSPRNFNFPLRKQKLLGSSERARRRPSPSGGSPVAGCQRARLPGQLLGREPGSQLPEQPGKQGPGESPASSSLPRQAVFPKLPLAPITPSPALSVPGWELRSKLTTEHFS